MRDENTHRVRRCEHARCVVVSVGVIRPKAPAERDVTIMWMNVDALHVAVVFVCVCLFEGASLQCLIDQH